MTKREKVLLQVLAAIAVVGLSFLYLFMPALKRKTALEIEEEDVYVEAVQVRSVVDITGLEESVEEEKKLAAKNYDYFYSKLNSYTIDGIINDLVTESGVEVQNLTIGPYEQIDPDTLKRGLELPEEESDATAGETADDTTEDDTTEDDGLENIDFLLGSTVSLTVHGSYKQVLDLVDRINKESTCIEVSSLAVTMDQRDVVEEEAVSASMILLIYGVNKTVEEEN